MKKIAIATAATVVVAHHRDVRIRAVGTPTWNGFQTSSTALSQIMSAPDRGQSPTALCRGSETASPSSPPLDEGELHFWRELLKGVKEPAAPKRAGVLRPSSSWTKRQPSVSRLAGEASDLVLIIRARMTE